MSELKPCPFCGGEPVLTPRANLRAACVWCGDCKKCGTGYFPTTEQAIEAWNTRHERTCRNDSLKSDQFVCTECGKWFDIVDMDDADWCGVPNFCPNCGAKVVEE